MRLPALLALLLLLAPPGAAEPAAPEPPQAPGVTVSKDLLHRDAQRRRWLADIAPVPEAVENPILGEAVTGADARLLRSWQARGTAAGLAGVFYENRDRGHSPLDPARFPQLTRILYDEDLRAEGADRSLGHFMLFPAPVLGNASLAVTSGPFARSLPRLAMTTPNSAAAAFVGYAHNHLYVYPGHFDVRNGRDLLPAMVPYFAISLGSSRSDQPILEALAMTLAALRPETRARLEEERLLAPTLTMLLRRGLSGTPGYLSPEAHPPAIRRDRLRPGLMMGAAQAMTPEEIPPLVRLEVISETFSEAAGLGQRSERLFDTPAAVARLWRGWEGRQEMIVSTEATRDPNGRPLQIHWLLISGDPARVEITPLDPEGRRARLRIDWHDAPFQPRPSAFSRSRLEIAAIAWNGAQYSAPSLVTVGFPPHQERTYRPGPDGQPRLVSVDYDATGREAEYDPRLWYEAPWRDEALRDSSGRIIGWRRRMPDRVAFVTPQAPGVHGVEGHAEGRPVLTWTPGPGTMTP